MKKTLRHILVFILQIFLLASAAIIFAVILNLIFPVIK